MGELPSTALPNNQSSARGGRQRDDQRNERKKHVEDVPEAMTSVFQM